MRKLSQVIHVRLSEKEKVFLERIAERLNISLSEVVRRIILSQYTMPSIQAFQDLIEFLKGTFIFNDDEGTIKPLYPEYYVIELEHYTVDDMEIKKYLLIWYDMQGMELCFVAVDWTSKPIPRYWLEKFITRKFEVMFYKRLPIWKLMFI